MMRRWMVCGALVAGAVVAADVTPSVVEAGDVVAGFSDTLVGNFSRPTAVEWLPDGRIAVLEQGGRLETGVPGGTFTTALTVPGTCSSSERGLLGLAPHPGYYSNGYIYLYSTRLTAGGTCVNRVSRFTMRNGVASPASEQPIIDNISSINGNHNGGDLDIGSDGYLYVSVGDGGRDPRGNSGSAGNNDAAQDLSLLNGKILRLTLEGLPAPGNPLSGAGTVRCGSRGNTAATPTTSCQEIFAWGLRNPYRIAFDRNTGADRFFINDVGQNTMEEVDEGKLGANYGWPMREGSCPQGDTPACAGPTAGLTDPLTAYTHGTGTFITAGAFVPAGRWPAAYDGDYLFADGGSGKMWIREPGGTVDYGNPFATDVFGLTDMTFGYDAGGRTVLYYVTVGGELRMIRPNSAPTPVPPTDAKLIPITPIRAYDTSRTGGSDNVNVAAGFAVGGTSRMIDLDPPAGVNAALVNVTVASAVGPGFVSTWTARADRPDTSTVNADRTGGTVANATIVTLDGDGRFVLDTSLTGRVIVDVLAWVDDTGGTSAVGRYVAAEPTRLIDTRQPAGTMLPGGSTNPYVVALPSGGQTSWITIDVAGESAVPDDGTATAAVISIAAISRNAQRGYVGAYPTGTAYTGTSNVNVLGGETRANLAVVPLGAGGRIDLRVFNVGDVLVDVLGYVTSSSAPSTGTGLYSGVDTFRLVDTREPTSSVDRLQGGRSTTIAIPGGVSASAVVQNVTVVRTSAWGFLTVHPGATVPEVSTVNYTAAGQTRAALAVSALAGDGSLRLTPFSDTDVILDILGTFSE